MKTSQFLILSVIYSFTVISCGNTTSVSSAASAGEVNLGYTTSSKDAVSDPTNSLTLSSNDAVQYNSMMDYIRDRVPGVEIIDGGLVIRGISTIQGSSDPLIMYDGTEIYDIDMINPQDVYSVDVLKDSAASMYGVKGTNGVIVIKSKLAHNTEVREREVKKAARAAKRAR